MAVYASDGKIIGNISNLYFGELLNLCFVEYFCNERSAASFAVAERPMVNEGGKEKKNNRQRLGWRIHLPKLPAISSFVRGSLHTVTPASDHYHPCT